MTEPHDELVNLEHTVDNHENDLTRHESEIKTLKESLTLLIEAVSKIDFCALQGMAHTRHGENAQKRVREILQELKAPPPNQ